LAQFCHKVVGNGDVSKTRGFVAGSNPP
jgi:hypothetical protein